MAAEATNNRIGILVGGGPAPGINGVIYAATIEACNNGREMIGIYDGFRHLMAGKVVGIPLRPETVAYIHQGGRIDPAHGPGQPDEIGRGAADLRIRAAGGRDYIPGFDRRR